MEREHVICPDNRTREHIDHVDGLNKLTICKDIRLRVVTCHFTGCSQQETMTWCWLDDGSMWMSVLICLHTQTIMYRFFSYWWCLSEDRTVDVMSVGQRVGRGRTWKNNCVFEVFSDINGGGPGAVVKAACLESRRSRVWTPLWSSISKKQNVSPPLSRIR